MKDRWYLLIFTCTVMVLTGIMVSVIERGPGRMNFGSLADWFAATGTILAVGVALFQGEKRRRDEEAQSRRNDLLAAIEALVAVDDLLHPIRSVEAERKTLADKGSKLFGLLKAAGTTRRPIARLARVASLPIADHRVRYHVQSALSSADMVELAIGSMAGTEITITTGWETLLGRLNDRFRSLALLVQERADASDLSDERIKSAIDDAVVAKHHASPAS